MINLITTYIKTKIARFSKEINLLKGVKKIDDNFFSKYKYLEKITLPNTVKYIGSYAFKNCKNLKEINLENVKEIHAGAFEGCRGLNQITIGSNTEYVDSTAFNNCNLTIINKSRINLSYINRENPFLKIINDFM